MPRPTNFVAFIRNVVRDQVQEAVQGLLGAVAGPAQPGRYAALSLGEVSDEARVSDLVDG